MLVKIIGIAFITAISAILLKATKPELSMALTIVGIIVILLLLTDELKSTLAVLQGVAQSSGMSNGLIKILLKVVGVGYIAEFSAGILNDFGSQALAEKVMLGSKIVIVMIALPVFQSLLSLINSFLRLV